MTLYEFRNKDDDPISNLLTLEITAGKQFLLDTIAASTGVARFRRTTANATLLDGLKPDQVCGVNFDDGTGFNNFVVGFIEDVTVEWGNPSTGGVYNADYVTVTWAGALAQWGRTNVVMTLTAGPATDQLAEIFAESDLDYTENFSAYNDPGLLSYEINGSTNDYLQFLATTTNCRYNDYANNLIDIKSAYNFPTSTYNFTDSTPSSTLVTYQASNWDSLSVNYYNQVLTFLGSNPIPVGSTDPAAVKPYRVLQLQTLWNNVGSALGYSQYLLDLYKTPATELSSVTCLLEAQTNPVLPEIASTCIGRKFSIVHRGTTVYGICEGFTMTASPGSSQFTFYFSNPDQDVAWFILDSSTQGKLDVNKLGF